MALLAISGGLCAAESDPPNIILIFCDDLGYGDIGPFGAEQIETPHLDRMAKKGMKLTHFYASANVCTPSRAGLLTGRYAIRMGLADNVLFPKSTNGLPASEWTLAEALKERGYATACIGKWHLGSIPEFMPLSHGFDYFYGIPYSNDMTPTPLYRNEVVIEEPAVQATLTERYTEEAVKFIEAHKDAPFFVYLPHTMPHIPLYASEKFRGKSAAGLYGDVVEAIDWSVGEIFSTLKRLDLDENTLVIFTSDNGPWYEGSSGGLRGRKGENFEGGQRVPFIAWWPGNIPSKRENASPTSNLDLLPTLVEITGGRIPDGVKLDGSSIAGILRGAKVGGELVTRPFYYFDNSTITAVRRGPWKLVTSAYYRKFTSPLGKSPAYAPGMLFNLETDPAEEFSLTAENRAIADELAALMVAAQSETASATAARSSAAQPSAAAAAELSVQ